jgi:formylmethanofuran dehydrogenase subunit E
MVKMGEEKSDWEKCVEFHGHVCPGLAMGYRAAKIGLQELAARRALDEELVAIVETDACPVDAVMVITGCTLGKGNLLFRDFGKHAYTFMSRKSGVGVRIYVKAAPGNIQPVSLRSGPSIVQQILDLPQEEFCTVQNIEERIPKPARIFNSITCAFCGEAVSEARARLKDGKLTCIPCAGQYTRGW